MNQRYICWAVALLSTSAYALDILPSRGLYRVEVKSYKEQQFGDVFRQQYDYSCGSAALATLLSYHYETPSEEEEIFSVMYQSGDKAKIEKHGFSLRDMKMYLEKQGFIADGYRLDIKKVRELGVPGITLVNFDGYMHFVTIKGVGDEYVILGDPSRGTVKLTIEQFNKYYQGIVLLIKNHVDRGRGSFIKDDHYAVYTAAPLDSAITRDSLGIFSSTLPEPGDN